MQTILQKVNQLSPNLVPFKSWDSQPEPTLFAPAPSTLIKPNGNAHCERAWQDNIQLTLVATDIVLNIPRKDSHLWTNKKQIVQALSLILKQNIKFAEVQKFFYLPTSTAIMDRYGKIIRDAYKRLYLLQ